MHFIWSVENTKVSPMNVLEVTGSVSSYLAACVSPLSLGCDDIITQAADQWSTSEFPVHSQIPSGSSLAVRGPAAPCPLQTAVDAGGGDTWHAATGGGCHWWWCPGTETQGCVCIHGLKGPEGLGPCWHGSPYIYYGSEYLHISRCQRRRRKE